jgi:hypothetical protein
VTILPLIERELRGRARSRAVYWTRFAVALAGMLLCLRTLSLSGPTPGITQAMLGHAAFQNIVTAAFILCCCAGFLTVDRISRERREGTLGLLCLTRVKALDVLLGSFRAAGITCVCALLALVPAAMLPVLTGGVTSGEAYRTMLVLFDTLLLSLAAGLWASAGARGWFHSARTLAGLLLLIIVAPLILPPTRDLAGLIRGFSPLAAFISAGDGPYRVLRSPYWESLALIHGIAWLFLVDAGLRLRLAMREGDGPAEQVRAARKKAVAARDPVLDGADPAKGRVFTLVAWNIRISKMLEGDDPVRWLVRRQRGIRAAIWTGVLIGLASHWGVWFMVRVFGGASIGPFFMMYAASSPVSLAVSIVEGSLFGWAASRFFVEGRRGGELELLLTTPVGAETIISSQWKEVRGMFILPVILLADPELVSAAIMFSQSNAMQYPGGLSYSFYTVVVHSLGCVRTVIRFGALIWAGFWFGLRARSQAGAIIRILLVIQAVPYLMGMAGSYLLKLVFPDMIFSPTTGFSYRIWVYLLPSAAILFYYFWLIRWLRRRLATELTNPSTGSDFLESISKARAGLNSLVHKARNWPPAPGV